jgi:hypothetical protein
MHALPTHRLSKNGLREAAPAGRAAGGHVENSRRKFALAQLPAGMYLAGIW